MFTTLDNSFPAFESILATHELQDLEDLDRLEPIYAGGYPTALLFAPRDKKGDISNFYCNDIDVYGKSPDHTQVLINYLDKVGTRVYQSNKAISFAIPGSKRTIQVIVSDFFMRGVEKTLANYDLVNCAVAFEPTKGLITMHEDVVSAQKKAELQFLNPWMLGQTDHDIIVEIVRCKKYCLRWNLTLSLDAFKRLFALYLQKPNISVKKGLTYRFGSGDELMILAASGQNIWSAAAVLFKQVSGWSNDFDPHGHIAGGEDTFVVSDPNRMHEEHAQRQHNLLEGYRDAIDWIENATARLENVPEIHDVFDLATEDLLQPDPDVPF